MSELLPLKDCPFCGYEAIASYDVLQSASRDLYCPVCGVSVSWSAAHKDNVPSMWNRRAPVADVYKAVNTPPNDSCSIERISSWLKESPRRPANLAFTEGPERQMAYHIEDAMSAAPTPAAGLSEEEREVLAYAESLTPFTKKPRASGDVAVLAKLVRRLLTPKPLPENVREALKCGVEHGNCLAGCVDVLAAHIRATNGGA